MGLITWERTLRPWDRPVKHWSVKCLKSRIARAALRARRGSPSRSFPAGIAFTAIRLKIDVRLGRLSLEAQAVQQQRLDREKVHSRMTERKRLARAKAKRRRIRAEQTCIYLWRRRKDWLREVQASSAEAPPHSSPRPPEEA